jgi:hypothetical protein
MSTLPSSAIFPRPPYERHRLATGKGNGVARLSLVKYNQPQGTPMLESVRDVLHNGEVK